MASQQHQPSVRRGVSTGRVPLTPVTSVPQRGPKAAPSQRLTCRGPHAQSPSAEQEPLLGRQPLSVDLVLLQLLVVRMPELHDDPLDVERVHSVRGDDLPVHLP